MKRSWMRRAVSRGGAPGLLLVGVVLILDWLRTPKRLLALLVVIGLALAVWLDPRSQDAPNELRLTVLDVGKGDAIVLESSRGTVIVVDSGGEGMDASVIGPYLKSRGIRLIHLLILTHPHPDHVGGAPGLIREFSIGRLVDNGTRPNHPLVRRYREAAAKRGIPIVVQRRGRGWKLPDGSTITTLGPPEDVPEGSTNDTSIVMRIDYGRRTFLLAADAQSASEREMISSGQRLAADVLKVGHHGSSAATSAEFVRAVKPRLAVISVDSGNPNGYPTGQTLDRLAKAGAHILRTDHHGHVTFLTDGQSLRYETSRPETAGILPQ